jgi:hypothetical protein
LLFWLLRSITPGTGEYNILNRAVLVLVLYPRDLFFIHAKLFVFAGDSLELEIQVLQLEQVPPLTVLQVCMF